jgi:large subunit ribosomal protein L24
MTKLHVKKDDTVVVITGKDKGKKGKVLVASPKDNKVIVEGVNIVARHTKPSGQGNQGGIIRREAHIDASNVMLYCDKCDKGVRVSIKVLDNGEKVRVCKKCGNTIK